MEIDSPTPLAEALRGCGDRRVLVADPSGTATVSSTDAAQDPPAFFVGPEGGFTPAELDLAAAQGAAIVPLGPEILRIETAAVALAAAWRLTHVYCE
jgi:16S rRNA (uracil1498-N3)-methyltransferase